MNTVAKTTWLSIVVLFAIIGVTVLLVMRG
jgi:hypothetical protein